MPNSIKETTGNSKLLQFFFAFLLLLVFYHFRYGLSFFNPAYINWVIDDGELANGFFSFGYYRHEPLTFPIGDIKSYFYPMGTNLYTSDIPLLALFFKPFSPILPEQFQSLGVWFLTCHLLQAWFSILLCERFKINGFARACTVVFFLFAPVLMSRFIHPSLFCQWMILASIWIYFIDPQKTPVRKILFYQFCLFIVSGLVFAYMWAMVFGFSVSLFLRLWLIDKKLRFFQVILNFSFHIVVMTALWLLIGLFSFEGIPNYQMEGWGAFSLNLNSLFNPMGTAVLLPTRPYAWPQHIEGYAYLGAGILTLLLFYFSIKLVQKFVKKAPVIKSDRWRIEGTNTAPLMLFFTFSFLFALSNDISYNNEVIFHYPLPQAFSALLNSFRSGGRFFWPVYYFIFLTLFYYFNRLSLNNVVKNVIFGCCLAIQLYDIQPYLTSLNFTYGPYKPPIHPVWETVIKSFDEVLFYPGFRRTYKTFDDYRYFTYYTTVYQKRINIGYPARFDGKKAEQLIGKLGHKIANEGLDERAVYVSILPNLNNLALPLYSDEAYCFDIDGYLIIFKKTEGTKALADYIKQNIGPDIRPEIISHFLLKPWKETPDVKTISSAKVGFYETDLSENHFNLKGWAFDERSSDVKNDSLYLIIESSSKQKWIAPVNRFGTPDVASFFNNPALDMAGFGISLISKNLPQGSYRTALLFVNKNTNSHLLDWLDHTVYISRAANVITISKPQLPAPEVKFDVNKIDTGGDDVIIESWAFPKQGTCESCKSYFILSSSEITYAAEAASVARPDVADFFNNVALINSGKNIRFHKCAIKRGQYQLGILLKDTVKSIDYFSETDKIVTIGLNEFSKPSILQNLPEGNDSIRAFVDHIEEKENFFELDGWAFIHPLSTNFSNTQIVLRSKDKAYSLSADATGRPDLKGYFNLSYDTDLAGFKLKFRKDSLPPGKYQICIIMENLKTNEQSLSCLNSFIEIKPK